MTVPFKKKNSLSGGAIAAGCVGLIAIILLVSLLNAWILMLLWGAIGATFWDTGKFRTIGYGTAYLLCIALGFIGSFFRSVHTK